MASIFTYAVALARVRFRVTRPGPVPPVGKVDLGDLTRTRPVSAVMGWDRGAPVDRYYIERFLRDNRQHISGHVLEVSDAAYTKRFGGSAVTKSDVLHLTGESPHTTIVSDLRNAANIEDDTFDCIILTQTLQFIYEIEAAIAEVHRILRPGGTLLCTSSGISQISRNDMDRWGDFWRLTSASAKRLFEDVFGSDNVDVRTYGNVLSAIAFQQGLAAGELSRAELDTHDDDYQFVVAVRATKRLTDRTSTSACHRRTSSSP